MNLTIKKSALLLLLIAAVAALPVFADDGGDAETKLVGAVSALPAAPYVGDWTVGGKTVHVTASTKLDAEGGTFAVGATV
jgi:hypothetical protein